MIGERRQRRRSGEEEQLASAVEKSFREHQQPVLQEVEALERVGAEGTSSKSGSQSQC